MEKSSLRRPPLSCAQSVCTQFKIRDSQRPALRLARAASALVLLHHIGPPGFLLPIACNELHVVEKTNATIARAVLTSRSRTEETAVNFKLMNSQQSRAAGKRDYIETNEDVKKRLFTLHIFTVLASPETDQNEAFLYL